MLKTQLELVKTKHVIYRSSTEKRNIHQSLRLNEVSLAYSVVGSPDYMAPEILSNEGYDKLVDFWSIGCIMFEFLSGFAPFTAPTLDEVWVNVYNWKKVFERPKFDNHEAEHNLTPDAWNLITKLICDRHNRISSIKEVQAHAYFRLFDLRSMRERIDPPFVPDLQSEIDTSYFDDFNNEKDMEVYKEVNKNQKELERFVEESSDILPDLTDSSNTQSSAKPSSKKSLNPPRSLFVGFTFKHKHLKEWEKYDTSS